MAFLLFLVVFLFGMCKSDGMDYGNNSLFGSTRHKLIASPNIVQFKSAKYGHCSGTLISPRQVLTSAKCIKGMKSVQLHIRSFEGHHAKRQSKSFTTIDELGVIKLTAAVSTNFSARFQPIDPRSKSNATVALWEFVDGKLTPTVRQVWMKQNERHFYIHSGVPCKPNVGAPLYLDGSLIGIMSPDDEECGRTFVPVEDALDGLNSNVEYSKIDHVASKCFFIFDIIGATAIIAYFCFIFYYVVFSKTAPYARPNCEGEPYTYK